MDLSSASKQVERDNGKDDAKMKPGVLKFKEHLKHYCDIYTEGPICMGNGARIISKALNMDGVIGDFVFNQKIVAFS
jgi:hypothetical protein